MKKNILNIEIIRPEQELIIMVGVSGSGKSSKAREIVGKGVIHSTDSVIESLGDYNYFFKKMIESGNFSDLSRVHLININNSINSIKNGITPCIIDNTNLSKSEIKQYVENGLLLGLSDDNIKIIKIGIDDLSPEELTKRNSHGVPLEKIIKMIQKYKNLGELTLKNILASKDIYHNKVGVYNLVNLKNGKVYIGSTGKSLSLRKKQHFNNLKNGTHENPILQKSYNKHGLESFKFEIIESFNNIKIEKLLKLEEKYILENDSTNRNFGYNICSVSQSRLGTKWSEESKINRCGIGNPMFGKGDDRKGNKNPMFGKNVSEETRNKLSIIGKGVKKPMVSEKLSVPIVQLDMYGNKIKEFKSGVEAFNETKIFHINAVCNGKRKQAGGYVWIFKKDYTDK
jgi:group I intron endonuclease